MGDETKSSCLFLMDYNLNNTTNNEKNDKSKHLWV